MESTLNKRKVRAAKIAALIKAHGRTQKELAAFLGYTPNTISERSQARKAWDTDEISAIASFLGVQELDVVNYIFA